MTKKLLLLPLLMMSLASCNGTTEEKNNWMIGILEPVEHPALDAARDGFKDAITNAESLKGKEITFNYRNAGGKGAEIPTIAKDLVSTCDMTFGIGTDSAKALKEAQVEKSLTKPVIFSAVTDPVDAGLVLSKENPSGFVCGTSDMQPIEEQIKLVKMVNENADKVGILFTQSESNSVVQADIAEEAIKAAGMTAVRMSCTGPGDVSATALALASTEGIDAIYLPTDNNIAANTDAIKTAVQNKGILVIAGEEGMLKGCGHVTLSIDYYELGKRAGEMAVSIIEGNKRPRDIPVGYMSMEDCTLVKCTANINDARVTIPESLLDQCTEVQ